ncbi:MAG: Na+/H+ antiporter subunit E [Rhizobiaceae bacterium]|nr:Na+/H+ antiporter subunit E [Rhizobiaceae bacterium]
MARLLPYPLLTAGLLLMWLLLTSFTPGQFVIGIGVAVGASHALSALGEASPPIRRWSAIPRLVGIVTYDILRSNLAVARILLSASGRPQRSGFVRVPIRLRSPAGLAILAIVITATPGTAWLDYSSTRGEILIHVFDLGDEQEWVELIGDRYERLLLEIFE